MDRIRWPEKFPKEEMMISVIRKTITSSWKNNLTIDDVNKWLDNFSGRVYCPDDEKKMALWMLCNFTYYNENEKFIEDISKWLEVASLGIDSIEVKENKGIVSVLNKDILCEVENKGYGIIKITQENSIYKANIVKDD